MVGGPAAGSIVPQLPGHWAGEKSSEQQVGEGEVVVGAHTGACATAVLE